MKIFAFTESYPSPYKPYHDTQFERFIKDGHELSIFTFGRQEGELNPIVRDLQLDKKVVKLPSTLKNVPEVIIPAFLRILQAPVDSAHRLFSVGTHPASLKQRLMHCTRAVLLPIDYPDLCIVHNLLSQIRLGFLKRVYPGVPIVFYYHGGEVPGVPQAHDNEAAIAFGNADVVFTNTESSRWQAISRGCNADKIFISPVGFNLNDFPEQINRNYRSDGYLQVLTVGRLSEEKGVIFALEAFACLRNTGERIRYRIVGDGPQESCLRKYVEENALQDIVEFLGRLPREKLMKEYICADVFLLPSVERGTWQENQACVVQEAMLAKAIIAASKTGGVPESTVPEMLQFNFDPESSDQIAAILRRLAQLDKSELTSLGIKGRKFVEQRYDIRMLNCELLEISMKITGKSVSQSS